MCHHILISSQTKDELFVGRRAWKFEQSLTKFINVGMPFARAIQCLESSHSTASDVLIFWLSVMCHLEELFKDNPDELSAEVMDDVRAISNQRFNGMINERPEDIYVTALFLDPRECADQLKYMIT